STNSAEVMEIITRLNRQQHITIILVTHDPDVAGYADRVVTFKDGVVISDTRKPGAPMLAQSVSPISNVDADEEPDVAEEPRTFGAMALVAAARALTRNKMRAALTMLGIFIGVAAVIAMVAVGNGARSSVEDQIASLGTNLIVVLPGATTSNGVR